jgi:hypothetical protein
MRLVLTSTSPSQLYHPACPAGLEAILCVFYYLAFGTCFELAALLFF